MSSRSFHPVVDVKLPKLGFYVLNAFLEEM